MSVFGSEVMWCKLRRDAFLKFLFKNLFEAGKQLNAGMLSQSASSNHALLMTLILWNAVSTYFTGQFTDFYCKVKKDFYLKELDFSA